MIETHSFIRCKKQLCFGVAGTTENVTSKLDSFDFCWDDSHKLIFYAHFFPQTSHMFPVTEAIQQYKDHQSGNNFPQNGVLLTEKWSGNRAIHDKRCIFSVGSGFSKSLSSNSSSQIFVLIVILHKYIVSQDPMPCFL